MGLLGDIFEEAGKVVGDIINAPRRIVEGMQESLDEDEW